MKTSNVLIGNDGTCKISDMGLSKMLGAGNTNFTAETMGTLAYISPEQIRTGRAGLPADIWALSTILWEVSFVIKIAAPLRLQGLHNVDVIIPNAFQASTVCSCSL